MYIPKSIVIILFFSILLQASMCFQFSQWISGTLANNSIINYISTIKTMSTSSALSSILPKATPGGRLPVFYFAHGCK